MNVLNLSNWRLSAVLAAALFGAFALPSCRGASSVGHGAAQAAGASGAGVRSEGVSADGAPAILPASAPAVRTVVFVKDAAGAPVAGADVWCIDQSLMDPRRAAFASRETGDLVTTSRVLASETTRTDSLGRAGLRLDARRSVLVAGELGASFGQAEFANGLGSEVELTLSARRSYTVTVVDPSGAPVQGVPLTIGVAEVSPAGLTERTRVDLMPVTSMTGPDGVATLHVPSRFVDRYGEKSLLAVARIPSRSRISKRLGEASALELVLPPICTLTLVAPPEEAGGDPWQGLVQVFAASHGSQSDSTLAVQLVDGVARIPAVEIGVALRVNGLIELSGSATRRDDVEHGRLGERLDALSAGLEQRVELRIERSKLRAFER